jgi:outer membrane protein assembly factor BamB
MPIAPSKPLRLWPGVVIVTAQWLLWYALPVVAPVLFGVPLSLVSVLGGIFGGPAVLVWWLFFSRAPWAERVGALVVMIVAFLATSRVVDESIANGMMGMMLPIFLMPLLSLALVAWAVAARHLSGERRYASMAAAIFLACGVMVLLRTGGITGGVASDLHWRWTETPEERLLAQDPGEPAAASPASVPAKTPEEPLEANAGAAPATVPDAPSVPETTPVAPPPARTEADWPGFRGPGRDDIVRGVRIETDWTASPPVELWRRPIGPGWSSFAVRGDLLYTQEQRGDDETVAAYNVTTGEPVWRHRDAARFWESNGGAGPRATPTVSGGRVYALGATGILNALDAGTGAPLWSRNAASDTGATLPGWGFAGSPLVAGDLVIVAASGRLAAYDVATGNPRWFGPARRGGYSSPHLLTIDGVLQILLMNGAGATSVALADGTVLWEHEWPGVPIVQPAVIAEGEILVTTSGSGMSGIGMRRLAIARGAGGWTVEERWSSNGLKPYFNDFVIHDGHAFGFDGSILACISLTDGSRAWKGGRYGNGQFVLLPDQDVLLVLSEDGELALVRAASDRFTELARFTAIDGKTWNHPVLAGNILLVRNGEEMAAFRLPLARRTPSTF